jgi:phytoene dehydrogenase-like protein
VIASGGAKETFGLLKSEDIGAEFRKVVDDVPLMESVFMIHLGLDIDPRDYLESGVNYCYRTFDISNSVDKLRKGVYHEGEDGYLICSSSFYSPKSAPEARYAVTVYTVAPNEVPGCEWSERKEYYTNRLLDLATEKLPAIREHIVEMEVFTPEDFQRLTHQNHHSFGGCAPVMGKKGVPHRTPVSGLWFIGSQSESGAGISNVMAGAQRVCRLIIDEYSSQQQE